MFKVSNGRIPGGGGDDTHQENKHFKYFIIIKSVLVKGLRVRACLLGEICAQLGVNLQLNYSSDTPYMDSFNVH